MHISSINTAEKSKPAFCAKVNLSPVADRLKCPEKVERMFSSATKNYPNDRLDLSLAPDGWLNVTAVDEFNNKRGLDLTLDLVERLFECPEKSLTDKFVLAFKTLKTGIVRDVYLKNEKIIDDEKRALFFDIENHKTYKIMSKMVEKDNILSDALFI